jgi:hypothetical protein
LKQRCMQAAACMWMVQSSQTFALLFSPVAVSGRAVTFVNSIFLLYETPLCLVTTVLSLCLETWHVSGKPCTPACCGPPVSCVCRRMFWQSRP